jgi:hypothetical protein
MKIALLPFCLFSAMSASAMNVNPSLREQAQRRCGDNLLCYFSANEIQSALGGAADWNDDSFRAAPNAFASEDESGEIAENPLVQEARGDRAPVWSTFISNFHKCAPGCVPADYETFGPRGHASCHNTGRAIDVGAIVCGGREFRAVNGGRFTAFVGCMKSKMKTLYHNGQHISRGHHDHVHFSMGCVIAGGRNYY